MKVSQKRLPVELLKDCGHHGTVKFLLNLHLPNSIKTSWTLRGGEKKFKCWERVCEKKERICVFGSHSDQSCVSPFLFILACSPSFLSLNFLSPTPSHLECIWCVYVLPCLLWDSLCWEWTSEFSVLEQTSVEEVTYLTRALLLQTFFVVHPSLDSLDWT